MPDLLDSVAAYTAAGLCVIPASRNGDAKRPAVQRWKQYQDRMPTEAELDAWSKRKVDSICIVCGAISGNLEMIDFDLGGEMFGPWREQVDRMSPGLVDRLVIETTPSGGRHVVYRCESEVCGNLKLAHKRFDASDATPLVIGTKEFVPRKDQAGQWSVTVTTIETRGEGGVFLCAPSHGYEIVQGDLCSVPTVTADERDILLGCAWKHDDLPKVVVCDTKGAVSANRPGDDFGERGDVPAVLKRHGWTLTRQAGADGNEHWCRPGKSSGTSATLKNRVFYVFSSNAPPFEPQQAYSPFAVYTMLEHGGDFKAAASTLRHEGYGEQLAVTVNDDSDVDLSQFNKRSHWPDDPGVLPDQLLRVPGFVSEVMDYTLSVSPYPNHVLSFCGAVALQSFLGARKVRDSADVRTNVYLLGLANSASGKDHPRKVNQRIMYLADMDDHLGGDFASGEGIQDAMIQTPAMLFQPDEIDALLLSINGARDHRHEAIMATLLKIYSSANSVYPMRRKAGREAAGSINQPSLTLFGTAIPTHYYEALSERMLTNGFFARMMILESGRRSPGQEPQIIDPPPRAIETAAWWARFRPSRGGGNMADIHPEPAVVAQTPGGRRLLAEARQEADQAYDAAEAAQDAVGTTVWGRVAEHVRKMALIYAVSQSHEEPQITEAAVRWATEFVFHLTRRMLYMAAEHVSGSDFDAECLRLVRKLREAPDGRLRHSVLLKRMKMKSRDFKDMIETLEQRGDIICERNESTGGRPLTTYQIA